MLSLSYLEFLLIFLIPPILLLTLTTMIRDEKKLWWDKNALTGLLVILFLALTYTTPWDNLMIEAGVWWYGNDTTLIHFWEAPLGEYLFFILQPILTAFFLYQITVVKDVSLKISKRERILGICAGLLIMVLGLIGLSNTSTFYLGSIMFWAAPILAIQWGFGWPYLLENKKVVLTAIIVPTIYLWFADAWAISQGLWTISSEHTVGISVGSLPLEEAVFFLVTNIFIVQGLVLYQWVAERRGIKKYLKELIEHLKRFYN